ncbi:hypothetical protein XENORESO_018437 [Xenotaenia resolanae]|uniref:Uncharacterized protein n=1 Tax=Xenotaenia resolanae TaxID=208358 RepID=A0ABV0X3C9_9TELE
MVVRLGPVSSPFSIWVQPGIAQTNWIVPPFHVHLQEEHNVLVQCGLVVGPVSVGTKGPVPTLKKKNVKKKPHHILPQLNFTLGTVQSGKYHFPGNHQTQTHSLDLQTEL